MTTILTDGKESTPDGGLFVVVEGIDGSGKTTVRRHLFTELGRSGHEVLSIPGYYWLIPEFTEVIVGARFHGMPYSQAAVTDAYLGDKRGLCAGILDPHLRVRSVVCDRFIASDIVNQVMTWDADLDETHRRYRESGIRRPDLILYLDTPPRAAIERVFRRGTTIHPWEKLDKLTRAYELFDEVLFRDREPIAPVLRIPNTGDLAPVLDTALTAVRERLPAPARRPVPHP